MLKSIEAKGDTIDAAVDNALRQLGMHRDDVSVEVLQTPKSGFFGLGKEPAVVRVSYQNSPAGKAKDFLEGLLFRFGTPAQILIKENFEENTLAVELIGSDMGTVIGRRGETLDAIQYLTGIVVNRTEEERWRVTVDTEGYRAKREDSLEELAKRTAQKALKYKKPVALDPMNPQERRIIHACLQDYAGVTTYSIGTEPNRKVVIAPEGSAPVAGGQPQKQANASSGTPHRRRRGGRGRPHSAGTSSQDTGSKEE
ncbi:MAG: RNA-binding cell elongation regulator Jag/EloR [Clostridiaceae bacterium]|nr:RNA-binding cell elongation regulator Jag/EloR [Clostridiaceae bacterium]